LSAGFCGNIDVLPSSSLSRLTAAADEAQNNAQEGRQGYEEEDQDEEDLPEEREGAYWQVGSDEHIEGIAQSYQGQSTCTTL